jgi:glycopeptide antibiotics resistance protein
MKKTYPKSTPFWRFFFVIYAALLLWLLFDRTRGGDEGLTYAQALRNHMNLVPFQTIGSYWKVVLRMDWTPLFFHSVINLGGNLFLFIPIGYLLPRLWPSLRNFFAFLLTCTLAITLVELLQLVTLLGHLDIDDFILNVAGMIFGYFFFIIFKK